MYFSKYIFASFSWFVQKITTPKSYEPIINRSNDMLPELWIAKKNWLQRQKQWYCTMWKGCNFAKISESRHEASHVWRRHMYFSGWEGTPGLYDARFWAGCRQKYDLYHPRDFFLTLNLLVFSKNKTSFPEWKPLLEWYSDAYGSKSIN